VFKSVGLIKSESDDCLFWYENNGVFTYIVIFIDDFMLIAENDDEADSVIAKLDKKLDAAETQGDNYLGLKIFQDEKGISVSQTHYVDKILDRFGLSDAYAVASPGIPSQNLDDCEESPYTDPKIYQEMVGSLMYLATATRPDISFVVSNLSRYAQQPRQIHENAVRRVFKYLKGTKLLGLRFNRNDVGLLQGTSDASWSATADAKYFSGYVVKLGESLITWRCKKQDSVALSSCEAETGAMVELVKELIWMRGLLSEIDMHELVQYPIKVKTDNQSTIEILKNSVTHGRTKHFRRTYSFVREEVEKSNLKVLYVNTAENEADFLTKNVAGSHLKRVLNVLNVVEVHAFAQ